MVLVQSAPRDRSFHSVLHAHPNPTRIAGMTGAIALNVAVLMALLVPMDLPVPQLTVKETVFVDLRPKIDPPPKPPEQVPVTPPRDQVPEKVQPRTVTMPVDVPPVVTNDARAIDAPHVPPVDTGPVATVPEMAPGPVAGVRLEYALAPPPPYPRRELAAGKEGSVILQVLVDVDGRPLEVDIHSSSGNRNLDRAAREHVLSSWTFRPAMRDGRPIQAIGLVPIDFKLQ